MKKFDPLITEGETDVYLDVSHSEMKPHSSVYSIDVFKLHQPLDTFPETGVKAVPSLTNCC